MKHSVKSQLMVMFTGLLGCLVVAFLILNIRFLEPYYINDKENQFVEMYEQFNNAMKKDSLDDDDTYDELLHLAEKNNISFLIVESNSGTIFTNVHNKDMLSNQLLGYFINRSHEDKKNLITRDNYEINQSKDPVSKTDYIEMWGKFDDGSQFLLRSPMESIKDSVAISNRFFLAIGCSLILISIFLAWYLTKRLTNPLRELTELSDRMANLDFDAKYTSGGQDEIGELGANFNRMSEKLESTISELKKANNSLQQDIEQKEQLEKMRNEFLGNVSHELKTPIALIQGYAEGLKEGVSDSPEDREFYCSVIMDEADKMNRMVKNLLTLNQLEFGEDDLVFERFDLTEVVRGVLQSMEIMAQQENAKVIFRQEDPVYVWADAFKIEQVVRNYVSNAFHHLDGEKVIEVKIITKDKKARVTVFNTGTPIPGEDLEHIWDKFYKVDKAHTREYGGNGIGLSIVKAIMKSLHQQYGVKNYDNGVEFWFEVGVE